MKKFTLLLFAMIMATVAFAQAPLSLNKQLLAQKPAKVQLTEAQKENVIGKVDGRQAKLKVKSTARPTKARMAKKVSHRLSPTLTQRGVKEAKSYMKKGSSRKSVPTRKPLSPIDFSLDPVVPPTLAQYFGVEISSTSYLYQQKFTNSGIMALDDEKNIYILGLCPDIVGWVKGSINENNIVTFEKGQYLGLYAGMSDLWFMGVDPNEDDSPLTDVKATWDEVERTLTFDENTWIVENVAPQGLKFIDIFHDVTVKPMDENHSIVIPPADMKTETYSTSVVSIPGYDYAKKPYDVRIGFDGDDAYVQGLLYFAPTMWLKGKRNADGSLTFVKNQYLGKVQGYDVYAVPCSDADDNDKVEIYESFTLKYDAENDTYTYTEENTNISFSVAPESTEAIDVIFKVVMKGPEAPKDDINTNVITEQPEGDLKVYTRGGGAYYSFWGYVIETTQGGTSIKIVTNGNDVYMENPISQAPVEGGSWVKGTLDGNKIHVPLKQCTLYSEEEGYGYMTATFRPEVVYDEDTDETFLDYVMTDETEVVFTINDDGTITLDHQSEMNEFDYADWIYGLAYTDNKEWAQLADFNSVYTTFDGEYTTIPEGLQKETWAMMYADDNNYSSASMVEVAIDGDKMYIAGMSEKDPEAAMVGTISDGKVTFASDQYLGLSTGYVAYGVFANITTEMVYDDYYDEYMEMTSFNYLPEYSLAYDAEKKTLASAEDVAFILNAGEGAEDILHITMAKHPKFNFYKETAAIPADPQFLDYSNWFDDYGYDMLSCNVLLEDVNGLYMNQDKVFYTIWVEIEGEKEQFVFDALDYVGFEELGIEQMTEIPVNFTVLDGEGYGDISASGSGICIYQSGFDDFGIQTIYYGNDIRTQSNIVWASEKVENVATTEQELAAGIGSTSMQNAECRMQGIYDLQGRKLQKLHKGVNIVTVKGKTGKIIVK